MKKVFFKLTSVFVSMCLLAACTHESFKNLSVFISCFDYCELSVEDFYCETDDEGRNVFFTVFTEGESQVLLKLFCNGENIIEQTRIFLPKYDKNGKKKEITTEDISLFNRIASSSLGAFTYSDSVSREKILRELLLYEKSSYEKTGELTKTVSNFHYSYLSTSLGCQLTVTDTYLLKPEEARRPESRPAFGDTTNMRPATSETD